MPRSKGMLIGFWIVAALFCLQISFTAYAELRLPQVARTAVRPYYRLRFWRTLMAWRPIFGNCYKPP